MSNVMRQLYEFGPFRLDAAEHVLLRDGEPVSLTPKAIDTLLDLVQNSGHVVGKDELIKIVWPDAVVEQNNLNQNISTLRKALGQGGEEQEYIETVPPRGYRFVAAVKKVQDADAELLLAKQTRSRLVIEEKEEKEGASHTPIRPHFHTLPLDPSYVSLHTDLGNVYVQKGMHKEAIAEFQRAVAHSASKPGMVEALGYAHPDLVRMARQ